MSTQQTLTPLDWTIWLSSQRRRVVNFLLGMLVVLGAIGLILTVGSGRVTGFNAVYFVATYAALATLFAFRRLPDTVRATGLLVAIYGFAALALYTGWLQGGGRVFLVTLLIVGGVLISPRAGFVLAAVVLLTYTIYALAFGAGWIALRQLPAPTTATPMITEGVGLTLAVAMIIASEWFLERALVAATQANLETQAARAQLARHAEELEAANRDLQIAKERAEEADRIKSQFLASMSHELRTPLNAILTFNELLAMGTFGPVNAEQTDYLQKSLTSGRHLLSLINDVLDVAKLQSGMMKLFVEPDFDIRKEVGEIAASTEKLLHGKPVKLVAEIEGDFPLMACDKRRVRQVLINLLANAAKFTEQGAITLRARRGGDEVFFSIVDTGPGITPEEQTVIFEPFVQTEKGIQHAGGTGLGLPISKSLVEAHGGRIWVESGPGKGSAFHVALPLRQPSTPQGAEPQQPAEAQPAPAPAPASAPTAQEPK